MNESLEHFFICCRFTKDFWAEVIKWFGNQGVKSLPSIKVFNSKIKMIHQLETMIAKSSNKLKAHNN